MSEDGGFFIAETRRRLGINSDYLEFARIVKHATPWECITVKYAPHSAFDLAFDACILFYSHWTNIYKHHWNPIDPKPKTIILMAWKLEFPLAHLVDWLCYICPTQSTSLYLFKPFNPFIWTISVVLLKDACAYLIMIKMCHTAVSPLATGIFAKFF